MEKRVLFLLLSGIFGCNAMGVTLKAPVEAYEKKMRNLELSQHMVCRAQSLVDVARKGDAVEPEKWLSAKRLDLIWLEGQRSGPLLALLCAARELYRLELAFYMRSYVPRDGLASDVVWCQKAQLNPVGVLRYGEIYQACKFSDKKLYDILLAVLQKCVDVARPIAKP